MDEDRPRTTMKTRDIRLSVRESIPGHTEYEVGVSTLYHDGRLR